MKPLAQNTLLQNRYLIVHLIGKGGMGEVYLAVDQRLGNPVALKRTFFADDDQLGNAFEREARTLARLRHAVLPKVIDHFIEKENQFLVMEHIAGDDLSKRLNATQKPFPLSWVLFWADQLLDALAYLHSNQPPIIHRDIKPQNLKLTDENNIILLDFGLSKNTVGQTNVPNSSGSGSTGSVVGYTPHYAPLEQIRGTGTNPRSDIFALSATLYQLLTNTVPFDALTRADLVLGGKPDPITPINEINSEIPRAISDVVLKGMSISQENRFAGAREMQKILREVYAGLQNAMLEKTIAFNAEDEQTIPEFKPAQPSMEKTEEFDAPAFEAQPASKAEVVAEIGMQTIPYGMTENSVPEASEPAPAIVQNTEQIQDFDATIQYDAEEQVFAKPQTFAEPSDVPPQSDTVPQQSNIKTEVLIGDDFAADEYLQKNEPAPVENFATENFANENFGAKEETRAPEENFSSDKTDPLVAFNNQTGEAFLDKTQAVSPFDSIPAAEGFSPTPETQFSTEDYSPVAQDDSQVSQQQFATTPQAMPAPVQPAPEKKKSRGVIFAVVGGLFGLLILAAGALGIGWYLMREPSNNGITNVSTPTPEPSVSPTAEQTPEQANTNTANGSNTEVVTTGNTTEETPKTEPTKPVQTQTQTTQPTVKPQTTRTTTQSTQRPTTPRPTGKPQVQPTIRGTKDIPQ